MMFEHMGLPDAAGLIHKAVDKVIADKTVTGDLAGQMAHATRVGCRRFAELLGEAL
jgi:isocitrate dehydrogenase